MRVAILLPGRIYGWQYCKESLKRLQEKYNATFFVSLNAEGPDESSTAFCSYFNLGPDQIKYSTTETPEQYKQYDIYRDRPYNFYSQWFQIKSVFTLLKNYTSKHTIHFDCIVKYRADIDSKDILSLEYPQANRFYCQVHHIFQTHDTIAYGDFEMMEKYSKLVDFYEYFYQSGMLMYGSERQHVKPTELLLFEYIRLLAATTNPRIDIIYFDFDHSLHPKRHVLENFTLNPLLD